MSANVVGLVCDGCVCCEYCLYGGGVGVFGNAYFQGVRVM